MEALREVRFKLFGRFSISVDGQEVILPEASFLTYLKLFLLSGEQGLANSDACPLGIDTKTIRDILYRGNDTVEPGKGGRYDFTAKTGLTLRYREGLGLELHPGEYETDVAEFVDTWRQRASLPDKALEQALEHYNKGINLRTWTKDKIFVDCKSWIDDRLIQIENQRKEIQTELNNRHQAAVSEAKGPGMGKQLNEEEDSHHEISGFTEPANEPIKTPTDSTSLRGGLGEVISEPEYQSSEPSPKSSQETGGTKLTEAGVPGRSIEPHNPNNPQPTIETSPGSVSAVPQVGGWGRTPTWLGVVVVAATLCAVFFLGYIFRGQSNSDLIATERGNSGTTGGSDRIATDQQTPDDPKGASYDNLNQKSKDDNKPVALRQLFRASLSSEDVQPFNEEVLVAKRIFPGYFGNRYSSRLGVNMLAVFRLDRQFKTFKCVLGLRDDLASQVREKKVVTLIGDGEELKRVELRPGVATPVDFPVSNVNTVTVTFVTPTVIVDGCCLR